MTSSSSRFALTFLTPIFGVGALIAACGEDATVPTPSSTDSGSGSDTSVSSPSDGGGTTDTGSTTTDTGTPQGDGSITSQEQAYCDARLSHGTCPGNSPLTCQSESKCLYGQLMTPIAATTYNACYAAPSCKSDDTCVVEAGKASGGAAATTYSNDCVAKVSGCPGAGVSTELCSPAVYAYTGVGQAASACLAKACAELSDCFKAAIAPITECKKK